MRTKKDNGRIVYSYTGSLESAIKKSESELKHINQYYDYYEWQYNDAKRKFEAKKKRRDDLIEFIRLAKEKLETQNNQEDQSE